MKSTSVIRRGLGAAALMIALGSGPSMSRGQVPTEPQLPAEWSDTDKWVWLELVSLGRKTVALDRHCLDAHPEPKNGKDARWRNKCRTVSPRFLRDLLARTPWQEAVPYGGVPIDGALIDGDLDLENARLVRAVELANSRVEGKILLRRARTDSLISLSGTFVAGEFDGDGLQSGADLQFRNGSSFAQGVNLIGARIGGQVSFVGATVYGPLNGDSLEARDVLMYSDETGKATFAGPLDLTAARISGNLNLSGARLGDFDLSGASIDGVFEVGTAWGEQTEWMDKDGKSSTLTLHNTHVGSLSDEENAWPASGHLELDGLVFSHLGGLQHAATSMVERRMEWWDKKWARLDKQPSTTPYTQLGAVLRAMGEPEASDEIRYLGRQRERDGAWSEHRWGTWLGLTVLWAVAGYGIGVHTFVVLVWVCLFTLAGAALLWHTVPAARNRHSRLWCVGASLSRLLPVIEINKEFTDFFNDPDRTRLNGWQFFAFSSLGVIGWLLAGILIAAMSSLTQKP